MISRGKPVMRKATSLLTWLTLPVLGGTFLNQTAVSLNVGAELCDLATGSPAN